MLSLFGTSTWAAVPEGVWTMPEPQGLEFTTFTDDGTHYILYNPVAKMFFSSGNNWCTQACLRTFGMEVWLQPATEEDAPEGSYELCDNNVNNADRTTGTGNIFTDDGNSSWVDHGTQGNYSWGYEIVGDCVRLQNVALIADKPEFAGMYLGWNGTFNMESVGGVTAGHLDPFSSTLRHIDPTATGVSVDWKAVTVESYDAFAASDAYQEYTKGAQCYIASFGLKEAIEAAEALNIDVTAALAVYSTKESTADDMTKAQADLNEIIAVKKKLKAAIEDYEAKGFTGTDAAKAVLNDPAATKADVEKAHADLDDAFVEWGKTNASVDNPVDMTAKIKNPHFDDGDCTTGWSGDAFGRGGTVADGAEHYSKNYNTYQKITGLTPGVYAVGVYGFYRAGNYGDAQAHWLAKDEASKYAKLYATVGENTRTVPVVSVMSGAQAESQGVGDVAAAYTDPETGEEVTVYAPNTMAAGDYYFHTLNQYANKLFVAVDESGELTIGVKKTSQISGDWSLFDDFSLTYYGAGADAYQLMLNEALKDYGEVTIDEGTVYTEAYLTAYKEALAGEKVATTQAEVDAIFNAIDGTYNELLKNIQLWKDWQDLVEKVRAKYVMTDEYAGIEPEIDDISDYVDESMNIMEILDAHDFTNEQLQAEMDQLNEWVESLVEKSKLDVWDGKNMTQYIKNADFEDGIATASNPSGLSGDYGTAVGWNADKKASGNFTSGPFGMDQKMADALGKANHCYEAWHCHNFDLWQEVKDLPVGMYELEVQGYVRCEVSGYTRGNDLEPDYTTPIVLYMNDATSKLKNVYSESLEELGHSLTVIEDWTIETVNEKQYPNSMGGAAQCFAWGMYKTTAYGLIAKEGDTFRIGVKMDANQDWWCIFDNFKLTYRKPTVDIVKPELENALQQIDTTQPMGKSLIAQAEAAQTKGQAALASNDAQEMFNALADIYAVMGSIRASVELFKGLQTAAEDLDNAAFLSENATAKAEAQALAAEISSGIASYSYEDAEVEGLKEQIAKATTKLYMPEDMASASDADPKECTKVIKSAAFENEEDYTNSSEGWTGAGNLGNDDTQKSVLAMEFWQNAFDMYQTIVGLPKGTYKLTVDAWCRAGGNDENFTAWQGNPEHTMAFLYAVDGDSTVYSAPVANVMKGLMNDNPGIEGVDEITLGEVTYYMPNSLVGGRSYMDIVEEGTYTNSVICKVGDDGKLTVGIKKADYKDNSWVVLDNFRLFYLGANSSAEVSGDAATAISTLDAEAPVKVEFFSLSGARINKPGKGVAVMKQTLSNGSVKIQKVIVK